MIMFTSFYNFEQPSGTSSPLPSAQNGHPPPTQQPTGQPGPQPSQNGPAPTGKPSRISPMTKPMGLDPMAILQERENRLATRVALRFKTLSCRFDKFCTKVKTTLKNRRAFKDAQSYG